jgi:hypothetical protein
LALCVLGRLRRELAVPGDVDHSRRVANREHVRVLRCPQLVIDHQTAACHGQPELGYKRRRGNPGGPYDGMRRENLVSGQPDVAWRDFGDHGAEPDIDSVLANAIKCVSGEP